MLERAIETIDKIAEQTDRVILFHSASGKDSICLLDLLSSKFREVVCIYMYVVKDLTHINRYINWASNKYENAKFIQIPHPFVFSAIKTGFMGCRKNNKQKLWTLTQLTDEMRKKCDIEWAFFGFKKSDSMNRRVMLRSYGEYPICEKTYKAYPLADYKNADIKSYIKRQGLVSPECYGKGQSSGTNITDMDYLLFLRQYFPDDLKKVLTEFPLVGRLLYEYDYEKAKGKSIVNNQAQSDKP